MNHADGNQKYPFSAKNCMFTRNLVQEKSMNYTCKNYNNKESANDYFYPFAFQLFLILDNKHFVHKTERNQKLNKCLNHLYYDQISLIHN